MPGRVTPHGSGKISRLIIGVFNPNSEIERERAPLAASKFNGTEPPRKSQAPAPIVSAIPVVVGERGGVPPHKIPLAAKAALTGFLAVMVPVYWHAYGPTNFLWFCDAALMLTAAGMWLESSLLISMCAVGILLPQCLWLADFGSQLLGFHLLGLTGYMFDPQLPLFTRALSLFHGWLPVLLVWLLFRVGYDQRALAAWSGFAAVLVLVCYFFTPPAGAHLADPNIPINLNYVYGFNDRQPQTWVNQNLYVIGWLAGLWLVAFLPAHLALRKIFAASPPAATFGRVTPHGVRHLGR